MAIYKTTLSINCGEKTCASEPGKFCRFLGTSNFGQTPVCWFPFDDETSVPVTLKVSNGGRGWTQRSKLCMCTFKADSDDAL